MLKNYQPTDGKLPYLVDLAVADPGAEDLSARALAIYERIISNLAMAYEQGDMGEVKFINEARQLMTELETLANRLAAKGLGVPFFD
ncbi:MAG TPA: hypothetical protein VF571_17575 [Pyrinomonadaceae bacterium]|jgi:hypothetical protein